MSLAQREGYSVYTLCVRVRGKAEPFYSPGLEESISFGQNHRTG